MAAKKKVVSARRAGKTQANEDFVVAATEPVFKAAPVPRFSPEGVLLNPEDVSVSSEGFVTPKG